MVSSPAINSHSGFGTNHSIWGPQLRFSALGGKPVKLSLMSHLQMGNLAMADFSSERLKELPLLQSLILRASGIVCVLMLLCFSRIVGDIKKMLFVGFQ
jgi:hypothetical protein